MASGWKFSVTVPSWTQTTLENDEVVVVRFYPWPVAILFVQLGGSAAEQGYLLLVQLSLIICLVVPQLMASSRAFSALLALTATVI